MEERMEWCMKQLMEQLLMERILGRFAIMLHANSGGGGHGGSSGIVGNDADTTGGAEEAINMGRIARDEVGPMTQGGSDEVGKFNP